MFVADFVVIIIVVAFPAVIVFIIIFLSKPRAHHPANNAFKINDNSMLKIKTGCLKRRTLPPKRYHHDLALFLIGKTQLTA